MSPTTDSGGQLKKRKKDRACDACRRRKTKCDGPWMPNNLCTNCSQSRKPCTYAEASKPRSPPKAYITGLEDRLEALEAILNKLRPDVDFSEELGPPVVRNSWKTPEDKESSSASKETTQKPSFTPHGLPPILIPFRSKTLESTNIDSVVSSPVSTHLMFHSQPRTKRSRTLDDATLMSYRDHEDVSDEKSATESVSSGSDSEEIVITSIVGRTKITLRASENDDSAEDNSIRFHGRSSTAGLVETTRQFKFMHMREALQPSHSPESGPVTPDNKSVAQTRRPQFWRTPFWEVEYEGFRTGAPEIIQTFLRQFPPPDLMEMLIDLYFEHSNAVFPLLHQPTFKRQWKDRLHHRNVWFTCLCLCIFAIGSGWCTDKRVLPQGHDQEGDGIDWTTSGLTYFHLALEIHRIRRSLFHPASLFEIQSINLMAIYMRETSAFPMAWWLIGAAIRKAQDVGAHRKKVYQTEPNIDDELWKRAFWHLVVLDRLGSASLGRACGLAEEDFDLDLPLEVDDDYWEVSESCQEPFKQPPGIPSTVTAFVQYIKLTQIMAFALRTLYAIDRLKIYRGLIPMERETLVRQLSVSLDDWQDGLPEHLNWRKKTGSLVFSCQATTLHTTCHLVRILIHRPLMVHLSALSRSGPQPTPKNESSSPDSSKIDPALTICTDAAKSCARIIEHQLQCGFNHVYVPSVIEISYISAATLILSSWSLKMDDKNSQKRDIKPPPAQSMNQNMSDIKFFVGTLESLRSKWGVVDSLLQELYESLHSLERTEANPLPQQHRGRHHSTTEIDQTMEHRPSPPIFTRAYQDPRTSQTLRSRHSIADLASYSRTEANYSNRQPSFLPSVEFEPLVQPPPPRAPISRSASDFDPVDSLLQFSGRSQHASTSISLSTNDRTLPFISSMRRTSHPNLSSREHQHLSQGIYGSRTSSEIRHPIPTSHHPEPSRYQDVPMHYDYEVYPSDPRYYTASNPHSFQTKAHGSGPQPHHRGYR